MIPRMQGVARIGSEIKEYQTKNGTKVAKFDVVFSEIEETLWLKAVAFGKTAELILEYFDKGDQIELFGRPSVHGWETRDGDRRQDFQITIERIGFVGNKKSSSTKKTTKKSKKRTPPAAQMSPDEGIDPDEIPF